MGKKWTRALWLGEKSSGLIQGYLMSIQKSHDKTNDSTFYLLLSKNIKNKKFKMIDNVMYYHIFLYMV